MANCLIGLGANLGDRLATLGAAVRRLESSPGVDVLAQSQWIESAAVGGPADQPPFLNGAVLVETTLGPAELLAVLLRIEDALGRVRGVRWGPRKIDLDLLLYDQLVADSPELTLPHPRMAFRRFVLEPAAQIAPEMVHPTIGWTLRELLQHLMRATPYVAIAGPSRALGADVATRVAADTRARLLSDAKDEGAPAALYADPAGRSWPAAIEFLGRRQQLVDRAAWPPEGTVEPTAAKPKSWVVSDFWFDQAWAEASVWLSEPRRGEFEQLWRRSRQTVVPPKLLVVLDQPPDDRAKGMASGVQPEGQSVVATRLRKARDAILRLAAEPGLGPVLRLSVVDVRRAADEVVAAMQAMQ